MPKSLVSVAQPVKARHHNACVRDFPKTTLSPRELHFHVGCGMLRKSAESGNDRRCTPKAESLESGTTSAIFGISQNDHVFHSNVPGPRKSLLLNSSNQISFYRVQKSGLYPVKGKRLDENSG